MQIAATSRLRRSKDGWIVPSQSEPAPTRWLPLDLTWSLGLHRPLRPITTVGCTCPDFELRREALQARHGRRVHGQAGDP